MGRKFWFGYMAFFVFVFPLFFSYVGNFISSPIWATVSLAVGLIGWIIFIYWTYKQAIAQPRKLQRIIHSLVDQGLQRKGTVAHKSLLKQQKDGSEMIEILVQFENLVGTPVQQVFAFTDTKPHQKRYEVGRSINLRLSRTPQSPSVVVEDMQTKFSWTFGLFALAFVVVYMIGTFAFHYSMYSNGKGWRFMSLWHPWIMTPFTGLLLFNVTAIFGKLFGGGSPETEEKLILQGKKAKAVVQRADQTGTYINEQPQIRYTLAFTDERGKNHVVSIKRIVPLTELHLARTGTRDILYLPDDPDQITFC